MSKNWRKEAATAATGLGLMAYVALGFKVSMEMVAFGYGWYLANSAFRRGGK